MKELKPTCDPEGVYSVKRTCAELGVSHKTLRKYRDMAISSRLIPKTFAAPNTQGSQSSNVGTFSKHYDKRIHHQQGQKSSH